MPDNIGSITLGARGQTGYLAAVTAALTQPRECSFEAAFLASDLSAYTTGSIVTINGGGSSRRSAL
jgi:enoyl-[acyl-carrier-protein] reductase (NADH)